MCDVQGLLFSLAAAISVCAASLLTACSPAAAPSALRIAGGEEVGGDPLPAVLPIYLDDELACTGTLITAQALLTAAHCVVDADDQLITTLEIHVRESRLHGEAIYVHPLYSLSHDTSPHDVAVFVLERPLVDIVPKSLASVPLNEGDPVALVGFGENLNVHSASPLGLGSEGVKRLGFNVYKDVRQTRPGLLRFVGKSNDWSSVPGASSARGDSGGPLLDASLGKIHGILSGGRVLGSGEERRECNPRQALPTRVWQLAA